MNYSIDFRVGNPADWIRIRAPEPGSASRLADRGAFTVCALFDEPDRVVAADLRLSRQPACSDALAATLGSSVPPR